MKGLILTVLCITAMMIHVVMGAHPFSTRCQNTGTLVLDGSPISEKTCCKKTEKIVSADQHLPELTCCVGVETSSHLIAVERIRESKASCDEGPAFQFLNHPPHQGIIRFLTNQLIIFDTEDLSPLDLNRHSRSRLGIWTC